MNELHIGNLTIKVPIIQGGMGIGVSMSGLASAVANEGGVGVIAVALVCLNRIMRRILLKQTQGPYEEKYKRQEN